MRLVGKIVALAAIASCAACPLAARAGASGSTFIRVNQVGYPATAPKRAYLMSHRDETGATFSVQSTQGAVALSGTVGPSLGSWST